MIVVVDEKALEATKMGDKLRMIFLKLCRAERV